MPGSLRAALFLRYNEHIKTARKRGDAASASQHKVLFSRKHGTAYRPWAFRSRGDMLALSISKSEVCSCASTQDKPDFSRGRFATQPTEEVHGGALFAHCPLLSLSV